MTRFFRAHRDLAFSLALAVVAAACVARLFFGIEGAPLLALWLVALPGFVNGLSVRGDRTVRCLPHFTAAALLFGLLLPLFAIGPPKAYDPATGTWHLNLLGLVTNRDAFWLWLSVAFIYICAALLGMVVRGLSPRANIRGPLLGTAIAALAFALAAFASLDDLWSVRLRHEVAQAGYCRQDADCADIGGYLQAGLSCYVGVNEREAERMRKMLAPYATDNSPYCRNEPRPPITCRNNRCAAWSD